ASEAVQVIEPGKIYDSIRAKAIITHAKCALASGDTAAADSDLSSIWEPLQARSSTLLPGPLLALCNWWEVKAQLEEHRRNLEGAREAMNQAIGYMRQLQGPYAQIAVARVLQRLSRLSGQLGDFLAAQRAATGAEAIPRHLGLLPTIGSHSNPD